jgi:predicted O-methyltransferase YrrM
MIRVIKKFLLSTSLVKRYDQILYNAGFKPGHYYSPIPNLEDVKNNADTIFSVRNVEEINLNEENQFKLLEEFRVYYADYPYRNAKGITKKYRYKKEGAYYRFSDAVFLYSIMRKFHPKKIIEVGSGHSSAIMLDVNEHFLDSRTTFTFIEPSPEDRLLGVMKEEDKEAHVVVKSEVQSVPLDVFQQLSANDILFIDSTHVSKVGSDLNYLMFEVLPVLKSGVLIHFHDIFYPFELPKHWVLENHWYWNENYLLRAFLMNNSKYEIIAFNTFLQKNQPDWFQKEMPECMLGKDDTGSIWLRKM